MNEEDKTFLTLKYNINLIQGDDHYMLNTDHKIPAKFFIGTYATSKYIPTYIFFYQRFGVDQVEEFFSALLRYDEELNEQRR